VRQLRSIRRSVSRSVLQSLVSSLVLPRLDYGNATLVGIPSHLLSVITPLLDSLFFFAVRPHHSAPSPAPLAEGFRADCFQVCRPRIQMPSRVCTVVPRRWTVSSGGRRGSSATPFCLVFITDRRLHSTIHRRGPSLAVAAARSLSGTVYPSTSLLRLRCLSFGHASRLISSPFPIPVRDHVYSARAVTLVISDTFIVHVHVHILFYRRRYDCSSV